MKEFMKTAAKTAIAITGIYAVTAITTYTGNYIGDVVSDLISEGIDEIPEETKFITDVVKKVIHKEKLFLKKFKEKLNHDIPEEEITLTDEAYENEMKDIEKEDEE
nr:MAG TPA: hypothetical protein [Caudoviricetes sp.]